MNSGPSIPPNDGSTLHRVEFFRLPASKKRDPFFGLSRGWYYKAEKRGEIKMIAVRQRGAVRGVRLVAYDSVFMPTPGLCRVARRLPSDRRRRSAA
jgi:hypothetical protein